MVINFFNEMLFFIMPSVWGTNPFVEEPNKAYITLLNLTCLAMVLNPLTLKIHTQIKIVPKRSPSFMHPVEVS